VTWVHTTAEQGAPVGSLFESAHRAGVGISIDVEDPFVLREDMADLARLADVVFLNSAAAGALGGPDRAARTMREWGATDVLVTLGAHGCLLLHDVEPREIPATAVEAIDANGAGDCFAAAFVVARIRGWDSLQAAEFANLVGAVSTTAYGGHGGDFSRDSLTRAAKGASMPWWEHLP
jgi:ribokinase